MDLTVRISDIVTFDGAAIVNAANESLLGGGGVDGAIHSAAGHQLLEACRRLGGCATGDAKTTPGFDLDAAWIIHAVGPVWRGGDHGEAELLASCYRRSLEEAAAVQADTVAFPAISTGAYRYPPRAAAEVAVRALQESTTTVRSVTVIAFDLETAEIYEGLLD